MHEQEILKKCEFVSENHLTILGNENRYPNKSEIGFIIKKIYENREKDLLDIEKLENRIEKEKKRRKSAISIFSYIIALVTLLVTAVLGIVAVIVAIKA